MAKAVTTGKTDGFLADAFHQAAVADDCIGIVVNQLATVLCALDFLGHGKAHGIGDPLTQRASCGFHRIQKEVFGVTCSQGAHLAEVFDLVQRDLCVTTQVQKRIDQHRAVAGRENETVTIWPFWC